MSVLTRRKFLGAGCGALASLGGVYVYARTIEPTWLDVVRLEMPLPRLPDAFAGFTIAQISDLHFGPFIKPAYIESVVDTVLALDADLIVITGDLVSRVTQGEPDMIVNTLSRLRAREGVYAILGNHDWWESGPIVGESLVNAGLTLLTNEHVALQRGGQSLYVAGLDDVWCGKHDLAAAVRGIPAGAAVIALVHEPDFADVVASDPRVILQLSGHSHGGQVRMPGYGALYLPPWGRKYPMGAYQIRDLSLYTNRGIGMVSQPVRFACRPEVTFFTLTLPHAA